MLSQVGQALAQVPAETGQAVGLWVAALLTLAVLSSVVGRNAFYRLAEALFVGIAAGYGAALAWTSVLAPRLALLVQDPAGHWHYALFFALGALLVARSARRLSPLAGLPLGIMVGVGAGLALGGALSGSLVAQVRASLVSVAPADYAGARPGGPRRSTRFSWCWEWWRCWLATTLPPSPAGGCRAGGRRWCVRCEASGGCTSWSPLGSFWRARCCRSTWRSAAGSTF